MALMAAAKHAGGRRLGSAARAAPWGADKAPHCPSSIASRGEGGMGWPARISEYAVQSSPSSGG
eukprot:CAMPEP_0174943470 /NCGR_PEP_ID=MMETSP1355-20121228/76775_1 /TAXON_ID=464990 /ORGANISM="Hemiselmis tepida, Strain CCMP443" /LENGTH=63 /DNA_ID=CAMNT_0016190721 /DNA_START=18 /DNA_END=206 /DNA_ORIENTATION=-